MSYRRFDGPPSGTAASFVESLPTTAPSDGGRVDVVQRWSGAPAGIGYHAAVGRPHKVTLAQSVTAGDLLATNGSGNARQATTGDVVVSRALESGSSGSEVWAVFENQRVL